MEGVIQDKLGIVVWGRSKVFFGALGLVGFGALVGAGSTYLLLFRQRILEHFRLQSLLRAQIQELQQDVNRLKTGSDNGPSMPGVSTGRVSAMKSKRKNGVRVTFQDGTKSENEDEFLTASSDSDYDEDAVVVFRNRKTKVNELNRETSVGQGGDSESAFQVQEFVSRIDKMFDGTPADQHEAYLLLKTNADKMEDSCEIWWRFAKATHMEAGIAASKNDKELQKSLLETAFSYAENALRLNDKSPDAHKWYAVTLGSRGEFVKTNEKIQNGFVFKDHIDTAISLNPTDGSLHHLLGRFCFEVSSLSWIERRVAATLFSEPPSSSYDEALSHFQTAERIWRPFIENRLYIAKAYIVLKDYSKAAYWLDQAKKLPVVTPNDKNAHKLVMELLPAYEKYLQS